MGASLCGRRDVEPAEIRAGERAAGGLRRWDHQLLSQLTIGRVAAQRRSLAWGRVQDPV